MSSDKQNLLQRDRLAAIQQLRERMVSATSMQAATGMPGTESAPTVVGEQYLVFSIENFEFAVKAGQVQGVERLGELTPVPNVAAWVKGVMNLRGSIISVVDLRQFLELGISSPTARTRLLSLQENDMVISFIVDSVSEMLPVPDTAILNGNMRQATLPHWAAPYAAGCALLSNRVLVLLDVARLLFSEKMQRYEAIG
ncbi:hypothetical protein KSD_40770 [Ktedonobacter sp. SOSP1-85]|uniref:chemotaxis protein CheW n=1 Tax=Ktedonobacter sp. SOSP1-85 TaxID=2778367 RepID=UPI001916ACB1|nr:chemotaxis protein CheW [Ktedonobacter sp. SOSP1-85]GHO76306.1 hypothetical protein KSD_40770 [Ktedonobacter sp. SOSP1-85]